MQPQIGMRVELVSLMAKGTHLGTIEGVNFLGVCDVKLDRQEAPVKGVKFYDEPREYFDTSLWQVCWPVEEDE